ncbi:MAG TPA: hypothetical protein VNA24_03370 [Hyalangium sp.]|nr:hypothetical protein [Hyalangium sp.]
MGHGVGAAHPQPRAAPARAGAVPRAHHRGRAGAVRTSNAHRLYGAYAQVLTLFLFDTAFDDEVRELLVLFQLYRVAALHRS